MVTAGAYEDGIQLHTDTGAIMMPVQPSPWDFAISLALHRGGSVAASVFVFIREGSPWHPSVAMDDL